MSTKAVVGVSAAMAVANFVVWLYVVRCLAAILSVAMGAVA